MTFFDVHHLALSKNLISGTGYVIAPIGYRKCLRTKRWLLIPMETTGRRFSGIGGTVENIVQSAVAWTVCDTLLFCIGHLCALWGK